MNKYFTSIFVLMAFALLPVLVIAQSFSVSSEIATVSGKTNDFLPGYITVTNSTNQDLNLRVAITSKQNLPSDWETQICFFLNCFPPAVETVEGTLQPGEADVLDITFITGETPGTAVIQVTVTNVDTPTDFVVLTYTATALFTKTESMPGPFSFALAQNYPNPFSLKTTIGYTLSNNGLTVIKVYNLLGKEIRTLVNEVRPAGRSVVAWDGRDSHGRSVSPGVYIYKLTSGKQSFSRRLSLTR